MTKISKPNVSIFISAPEQPIVTVKRLDSTSIRVSWKLKNGNKGIKYFLVMYHPVGRESEKITKNTTKMELTVNGLEPDTEYEFVVSNVSMVATGQEMVRGKNSFKVREKSGKITLSPGKFLSERIKSGKSEILRVYIYSFPFIYIIFYPLKFFCTFY